MLIFRIWTRYEELECFLETILAVPKLPSMARLLKILLYIDDFHDVRLSANKSKKSFLNENKCM